jgi:hypothetical protein
VQKAKYPVQIDLNFTNEAMYLSFKDRISDIVPFAGDPPLMECGQVMIRKTVWVDNPDVFKLALKFKQAENTYFYRSAEDSFGSV